MTKERANPVARYSIAEHRVHVLACGYDVVLVLVDNGREVDVGHWSRVAMASERYDFRRFLGHCSRGASNYWFVRLFCPRWCSSKGLADFLCYDV
jgi:hypothetical protein